MGTSNQHPLLFTPLELRGITSRNRIMVSPMCQYSSEDGFANDWHLVHLGTRAVGGAGVVMAEATAVEPEGRISPGDLGIWDDAHIEMLSRITAFISEMGAVPAIQIAHAGRKASSRRPWEGGGPLPENEGAWQTVAPSPVPFDDTRPAPVELSRDDIQRLVASFAAAARRAREAGFTMVEIHGAHGYLVHEFLSEYSNRREDEYGGSFDNRSRFAIEVAQAVRSEWPAEYPLAFRVSATEWVEGGWDVEDSVRLTRLLLDAGVDIIDASSGGNHSHVVPPAAPGYQVPFAEQIRRETGAITAAVGIITRPEQAEDILAQGQADIINMGRELLRDPYWPLRAAEVLGTEIEWQPQYLRAKPALR